MKKSLIVILILFVIFYGTLLDQLNSDYKDIGGIQTSCTWEEMNYVSSLDITYEELIASNKIINGDFNIDSNSDGLADNWVQYNTINHYIENNIQYGYVSALNTGAGVRQSNVPIINNHTYYFYTYNSTNNERTRIIFYNSIDGTVYDYTNYTINKVSFIHTFDNLTQNTVNIYNAIYENDLEINDLIYFSNVIFYDLTQLYGMGNEPTLQQFEELLNRYESNKGIITFCDYEYQTVSNTDIDGYDLGTNQIKKIYRLLSRPFNVIKNMITDWFGDAEDLTD